MSSSGVNLEEFLIPLEEIRLATENFSENNCIEVHYAGRNLVGDLYRGQLSEQWQNRTVAVRRKYRVAYQREHDFRTEVEMMSILNHENIISFIGYCDEGNEMIAVFEYAVNRSLDQHLRNPDKRRSLTWVKRLEICLGTATGLEYLHSGLGEGRSVIHRKINPRKILLDDNFKAKIRSTDLSILVNQNQPHVYQDDIWGTDHYMDPLYREGGNVRTESDVYSFGVVMFEVLSGTFAYDKRSFGDNQQQQTLIGLVRSYYDDGLENLIDPDVRDQVNIRSFRAFRETAYQCISWNLEDRPTMKMIIKRIQEALNIQNPEASLTITAPRHKNQNLESSVIPLKEILLATQDFSQERYIGGGGSGKVYKGELLQNRIAAFKRINKNSYKAEDEFRNELRMVSSFHHENIIGFIGYCDEDEEKIIVYDYAINGSVHQHLHEPETNKRHCLTWSQRLKICIGAARGLEYLHSGLEEDDRVIHRDIKVSNLLLDDDHHAKISDFALSLLVDRNLPDLYDLTRTSYYTDPIYEESGLVNTKSDVYSFGVVLLEILSGMKANHRKSIGDNGPQNLINLVRRHYDDGLDVLIDPLICDQVNSDSFRAFIRIVYRCISLKLENRPTMKRIIKRIEEVQDIQNHHEAASTMATQSRQHQDLQRFRISLEEIKLAIKDFSQETPIGDGGYGKVYKSRLSERWANCIVAIKRLDPQGYQGKTEFSNEVKLLSRFHHRNIIPFVGFCDEGDQMIIVSKYATNGSLDIHLQDPSKKRSLSWSLRLNICLGAAKGLDYLHSGLGKDNGVIHRDVKSGNILLDENFEAKICDFGLSKEGTENKKETQYYTKVAGTNFYLDPLYRETNALSRESDVYSFGVVLFEMLTGMMAYGPKPMISLVRRDYKKGLENLIDPDIKDQIDNRCSDAFKELAWRCISFTLRERPTMETIIEGIEDAIELQARTTIVSI